MKSNARNASRRDPATPTLSVKCSFGARIRMSEHDKIWLRLALKHSSTGIPKIKTMARYTLAILLLSTVVFCQSSPSQAASSGPANVAPDTAVITIKGVCDHPANQKPGPDCKKVITRGQFEAMVQTVQPNLPVSGRRKFAESYVEALVADEQARGQGVTSGPTFELRTRIAYAQAMAQELGVALHQAAMNVSDKQIEEYYQQNPDLYVEADLTAMLVPGIQQLPDPPATMSDDEKEKRVHDSEALMKTTAERLRQRAASGDDMVQLQAEAFQIALVSGQAPPNHLGKVRGTDLPAGQRSVMELKPGEVSGLLPDRRGYMVYKIGEKRVLPLAEVRDAIRKQIADERIHDEMDTTMKASTITLDETYFGK